MDLPWLARLRLGDQLTAPTYELYSSDPFPRTCRTPDAAWPNLWTATPSSATSISITLPVRHPNFNHATST
jgi:hypothetical protein